MRVRTYPDGMTMTAKGTVVVLHGLGMGLGSTWPIRRFLRRRGYHAVAVTYPSRSKPLDEIVAHVAARIALLEGPIHFVTHSYGGVVAHRLLTTTPRIDAGRVVMLAPPHGGSEWADLIVRLKLTPLITRAASPALVTRKPVPPRADYDLGIIAGTRPLDPLFPRLFVPRPNDGKVSLASTRLEGMADHLALPVSHTLMVWNGKVMAQIAAFLATGRFQVIR
jgi:pimeloyl-ACP methyl ester carboxylesterase